MTDHIHLCKHKTVGTYCFVRLLIDALTVYTGLHICAEPGVSNTTMEMSHYSLSCAVSVVTLNILSQRYMYVSLPKKMCLTWWAQSFLLL
jgi:hypothetical protein